MGKIIRRFHVRKGVAALAALFLLVSVLPPASQAAEDSLLVDFEDGTIMGFDVRGSESERASGTGVLTAVTEEAHSGKNSLLITERKNGWNGPAYNVESRIVPGAECTISVWVLPKTPERATFMLSTEVREDGSVSYINLDSKTVSKDSGWTELTGQYSYDTKEFVTIYVESSTSDGEYYIDDFTFTVTGGGEDVKPWDPATDPLKNNKKGTYDGFDFEYWSQNRNEGSMMLTGGGTFNCEWDGYNLLFRTGKRLGSTSDYKEYGTVTIEYDAEYKVTRGDVSYLCVYGWTEDPMIEFYVLDSYASYKPGSDFKGTIEVDGGTYEVYESTRVNQPSIQGTKTFQQYFSIRTDKRTSGTITISDHFKGWESLGMDVSGKLYEVSLCVEGFSSAGSASVTKHVLTVGDEVYGAGVEATPATTEQTPTEEATLEPTLEPSPEVASPTTPATEAPTGNTGADDTNSPNTALIVICVIAGLAIVVVVVVLVLRSKKTKK